MGAYVVAERNGILNTRRKLTNNVSRFLGGGAIGAVVQGPVYNSHGLRSARDWQ